MLRGLGLWLCILLFNLSLKAQVQNNFRVKKIITNSNPVQLDSLSIIPGTFTAKNSEGITLDSVFYSIDFVKSIFTWKSSTRDSLQLNYRVFPLNFGKKYFHKDFKKIQELPIDNSAFYIYKPLPEQQGLLNVKGLNKNGSISRGLMFGNNQNMTVNSNMSLQLAGKIANDIDIVAAISDDNLPIQPDGNTQQLNEFDKVFVQLKRDSSSLVAGDYELHRPQSYFMNFYKKTQGAMLNHRLSLKNGWKSSSTIAAAVAKGRSTRQTFNGEEGNQGPYRLTGANGENYIIIMAGTERVYIDGIALLRGQENDYVIDYNTAEITFTPKKIINQNSRISIEFEYSDKNYSRSLTYLNQEISAKKTAFRFNFYNEKDNRNRPFLQTLSDGQKQFLANLGSNINEAFYPNITETAFNENEILYEKLTSPIGIEYYRYSINPQTAKYRLGFSYVGQGKGNYQINNLSTANGRVYEFVEPIGINKQGDYEPITLLVTPKQQQMITLGIEYKAQQESLIAGEFALSNNDVNLYADKQLSNARGYGLKLNIKQPFLLNKSNLKLVSSGSYELTTASFKAIERYRELEFVRDFNLENQIIPSNEQLIQGKLQVIKEENKQLSYSLQNFSRIRQYEGFLHQVNGKFKSGKYSLSYDGSFLKSDAKLEKGSFYKNLIDVNREILGIILGVGLDQQQKLNYTKSINDSLNGNSFSYQAYQVYIQNKSDSKNRYRIDYSYRKDELPLGKALLNSSQTQGINLAMTLVKNSNSLLDFTVGYRKTNYENNFSSNALAENIVGRLDYKLNTIKGFLNSLFYYEVGNGQEPRREMTYLEVMPGQGVYAWNDYNNNGIKELDEFEISLFPDQAKYIRIFTTGTSYVRTNFTGISHSIRLNPSRIVKNQKGISGFIAKLNNDLTYKIDRKILAGQGWQAYNPFITAINESNLISLNYLVRNLLVFNKSNPKFGVDFQTLADGGKSFLNSGFDSRNRREMGWGVRTSPLKKVQININWTGGNKTMTSALSSQRNYEINYLELVPEISYLFTQNFRLGFNLSYNKQQNLPIYGDEKNTRLSVGAESRYHLLSKGVITAKLNLINNEFVGNENSATGYEMLSGLQTGNNLTWALGLQRSISNGIQLNLNYEGRKSPLANTIHTGNMQVRAYF